MKAEVTQLLQGWTVQLEIQKGTKFAIRSEINDNQIICHCII